MSDESVQVNKKKFDALLQQMLKTPPLPKAEISVKKKAAKATNTT